MKVLLVVDADLPALKYGGTERVVWYLAHALLRKGHQVGLMARSLNQKSELPFYKWDESKEMQFQIPDGYDVIHFHFTPPGLMNVNTPYLVTMHGNPDATFSFERNTVFVSQNHAQRYGATAFVYNGLDWADYPVPDLTMKRTHFHFLGKAAWRVKNVRGAINLVRQMKNERLCVMGGTRLNLKMGLRLTLSPRIRFYGMVGGTEKARLLNSSKGLIFPVLWPEPFGLAIIESLYYGCPVFGTPRGSLPELVPSDMGVLSDDNSVLLEAMSKADAFDPVKCHDYAQDNFNADRMAEDYLAQYAKVIAGEHLNMNIPRLISE
jgi:glycosyltransferase involved in cell wall biosynthesis